MVELLKNYHKHVKKSSDGTLDHKLCVGQYPGRGGITILGICIALNIQHYLVLVKITRNLHHLYLHLYLVYKVDH